MVFFIIDSIYSPLWFVRIARFLILTLTIMKNVISTLLKILKALPIVIELLEMFTPNKKATDSSSIRQPDKDIIDNV